MAPRVAVGVHELSCFVARVVDAEGGGKEQHGEDEGEMETASCLWWVVALGL